MVQVSISRILSCLLIATGSVLPAQSPDALYDKSRLRDLHFTFKQSDWWTRLRSSQITGVTVKASLMIDKLTFAEVGIHVKGNSSARVGGNKLPFNLVMDAFDPDQRLYGYRTVNLNNAFLDPTYTREVLTYELMERYLPTPQTAFARVYLNNTFWGVYILVEQPNKDFLRRHYRTNDGARFKGDPPNSAANDSSTFVFRGASASVNYPHYDLKSSDPKAWDLLLNLTIKLNRSTRQNLRRNIEQVINVDRALWYLATHAVIHNLDSYIFGGRNFYCCFDPDTGLMNMIPWDANMGFGSFRGGTTAWSHPIFFNYFNTQRPLASVIWSLDPLKQRYLAHVRTILEESYQWDAVMKANNDRYQAMIDAAVKAEPYRQYSYADFRGNITKDTMSSYGVLPAMKTLVDRRRAYLLADSAIKKLAPTIRAVQAPASVSVPGQAVWVRATVVASAGIRRVTLHTADLVHASYQRTRMYDDGKHRDGAAGDGIYGASFPAAPAFQEKRFYVESVATNYAASFHPRRAEYTPYVLRTLPPRPTGPVLINELLADNDAGDVDEKGETEDWVELINTSSTSYDLTGHFLTDDIHEPRKWMFPAGTKFPAGGFLRVWCDNEPADGPLHATFKLSDEGEELFITDAVVRGNAVLDGVLFGEQKSDRSFGSVPDGGPDLFHLWDPSGGQAVTGVGPGKAVRFDPRLKANPSGMDLKSGGALRVGKIMSLQVFDGPARGVGVLGVSLGVSHFDLGVLGPLMLDPTIMVLVPLTLDANGFGQVLTPALPANLVGLTIYAQALVGDLTNALAIRISR